jgi:hypothetical protein
MEYLTASANRALTNGLKNSRNTSRKRVVMKPFERSPEVIAAQLAAWDGTDRRRHGAGFDLMRQDFERKCYYRPVRRHQRFVVLRIPTIEESLAAVSIGVFIGVNLVTVWWALWL